MTQCFFASSSSHPLFYRGELLHDDLNLYAYVGGDPVNKTDPTGEFGKFVLDVGLEVAVQVASGQDVDIGAAVTNAALGALNPVRTIQNAAKVLSAVSKAERFATNVAKGASAEKGVIAKMGDTVAGTRVTLESSTTGRRSVADIVSKDTTVTEVKSGNAQLSQGQKDVKADIDAGREVIPRGQNAERAGLEPNKPVQMKCYKVDRCP